MELAMVGHFAGHAAMDDVMSHHSGGHDHGSGHDHVPDPSGDSPAGHDHAASEGCNACAAYCALTPLLSSPPTLADPLDPTAVTFSDLCAPPPSFVSDGLERPPRTI